MTRLALLGLLLWASPIIAGDLVWKAEVQLDEGTVLLGVIDLDSLTIVGIEEQPLALQSVVSAKRIADRRTQKPWGVEMEDGGSVNGAIRERSFPLKTLVGSVDVPLGRVVEFAIYPEGSEAELPATKDLVLYLDCDRPARGQVRNVAGPQHHATVNGAKWTPKGKRRGAYEFDGPARLEIPHHADLCPERFTLAAWIRATDPRGPWRLLISKTDVGSWHGGYGFCRYPDDDHLYFYAAHYSAVNVKESIPRDEWLHIAGTFDGKQVMMYVNGEPSLPKPIAAAGVPMTHTTTPFLVGGGGGYDWVGAVDELVLYRRALSIEEIEKLMIATSPADE